ncbi:hypothetical protein PAECIP111894_03535 [Paenibacillus pseudetheri]|uniref:Uncharacterized protein n=1 Tax=Paenibacillus pseudetheri TaxID=2897682 RepID=A0ABM9BGZ9_9BACL|nr:hypothetical protein PAECIP111894_03535 [Paenibacillus pseudetheri]
MLNPESRDNYGGYRPRGSAVGHKKLDRFDIIETDLLCVSFLSSVEKPVIRSLAAYHVE